MTDVASYSQLNAEVNRQLADARQRIQSVFKAVADDFFLKCPEAHAIQWIQGTPSWNDGESCSFAVHETNLYLTEEALEGGDSHQDILRYRSRGNEDLISSVGGAGRLQMILAHFAAVDAFISKVGSENMQLIFGDGAKITVSKEALEIEEHSLDY